jgi:membrane protease subunit HflK
MSQENNGDNVRRGAWEKMEFNKGDGGDRKNINIGPLFWLAVGIVVLLWLATGIYTVGPGEVGIIRQFGRFTEQTGPGLNYRFPWPIQAVDVVNVSAVRRSEIGFRTVEEPGRATEQIRILEESMMLTSDKNIADVQVLVLYQVKDASLYLFGSNDPERFLRVNTEIALRSIVGGFNIDHIMTVGRAEVEAETWEFLQILMDDHNTGLHIVGVELQTVDPPDEVREAFYEVVRAKADEERLKREAEGYALDVVPRARGDATRIIQAATAYKEERILIAEGEAERFVNILGEYRLSPEVTRKRLHLETIERVLAEAEKFIIDPNAGGNVTPLLPIADFGLQAEEEENE